MDQILKEKLSNIEKNQNGLTEKLEIIKKEVNNFEKTLISKDSKISIIQSKLKDLKESLDQVIEKVQKFEIKMESIHLRTTDSENKWSNIIDFFVKIFWVIVVAYLLYKLGLQGPPA